jgi:hypothetical protein
VILRFFPQTLWEADPEIPDRLFIQAGLVGGYRVTFDCVAEIQGKPDSRLWSLKLALQDGVPDASYTVSVGHPSRKVVIHSPQTRPHWCCVVEDQVCLILPDFKP